MRGLKQTQCPTPSIANVIVSHLLQMRGLKQTPAQLTMFGVLSHLLQMRGLKPGAYSKQDGQNDVASFTDAWIETDMPTAKISFFGVASFTDAWIETGLGVPPELRVDVASFTDAWIETDWLPSPGGIAKVASFTDAWIETS